MATTHMNTKSDIKEWLPRIGYITRGVIYFLIGALAVMTALGEGGKISGSKGALSWLESSPFGDILLGVIGIGLFGYSAWRFVQTFVDPENRGTDAKGIVARTFTGISGLAHVALGVYAFKLALDSGGGGGSSWSAKLMSTDFGPWLVGLAGLGAAGFAIYQFYAAYKVKFLERLDLSSLSQKARKTVKHIGQAGLTARGIVVAIIAWFLLRAAMGAGSAQSAGLGHALETVAAQSYGTILLFLVAAGLAAFGVYSCVKGYYRRIDWA